MSVVKAAEIEKALLKKGFRADNGSRGNSHRYYFLWVNGKKTRINTYLSHDGKEYGDELLAEIKRQLCFKNKQQLLAFVQCYISESQYVAMLYESGIEL